MLDCACGVGYGSYFMAKSSFLSKLIAVEKDRHAIRFAKRHYHHEKITYIMQDIFSLDVPDNYFNCIVCFETLEHITDDALLIDLFYRKLKKEGLLIASVPNQDVQPFDSKKYNFHLRYYNPLEFSNLLSSGGFDIIGKYTQHDRRKEDILKGWDGLFNIAVAKKL